MNTDQSDNVYFGISNSCLCLKFILLLFITENTFADRCATAEEIQNRKISQEYDWSVDERMTLDDVLAVGHLFSVRIKDNGEFVSCHYTSDKNLVRLDGIPLQENCFVAPSLSEWRNVSSVELVCIENNLQECTFLIKCGD